MIYTLSLLNSLFDVVSLVVFVYVKGWLVPLDLGNHTANAST